VAPGGSIRAVARDKIVPERSRVWIDARSNVHPIHSSTDGLVGYVELELGSDGEVDVSQQLGGKLSLPVSRLSSGNRMEDRELQKRIESRRYPTIDGVLKTMERSGTNGNYRVAGDVNFRGVVRPHKDEMTVSEVDAETIQLAGKSQFDIREFGMEPPRVLLLKVSPEVDIRVEIVAVKES
jgi:polyisoprenoid-binding protein YceI